MEQKMKSSATNQVEILMSGSKYIGPMNELGMQDLGVYFFPDGTRYTGEFLNNRFHGRGTIQMPDPSGLTYQVTHRHGRLTSIDEIHFNDSLPLEFEMNDSGPPRFESWLYCTSEDRRFYQETKEPMEAVGPKKFKNKDGPNPFAMGRNVFDLGFGQLGNHGFMVDRRPNGMQSIYVGCREARRWTRENCAHGPLWGRHHKQKVMARFAREIIENNQENAGCRRKQYMPKAHICRRSCSMDSFGSERLHLGSTTDTMSSEVQAMRLRRREFRNKWRRSKSESNVCRIN
ncbi:uncharacterized protein LOC108114622 [Drosophila eugracilis]|uniref:uncharacterized protein LOC108114622 n=1 Tax=Drosophila eugracilis TaxID=29029 RepID=UPI0007E86FB1|nr:uncharacterized protein LOC108114622 [Drosophila eugracilis]